MPFLRIVPEKLLLHRGEFAFVLLRFTLAALHLRYQQRLQLLLRLKPLLAALGIDFREIALMQNLVLLDTLVVSFLGDLTVDVKLLHLRHLSIIAVIFSVHRLREQSRVGVLLLLHLRLTPLCSNLQTLVLREVSVQKLPFVELHSDAVHFGSIGKIVLLAGSVSDTSRSLLAVTPLLFSGKAVGNDSRAAATAAVRNIDISHAPGIGDSRLRDVIFLTQILVSLIQLPLLRDIGVIGRARSVQCLACRSHLVSVGSNID